MTPLQTFSLSIWREWRARWPVFALAAACALLPAVLPERQAGGWALFALLLVLPALVCFSAAGGSAAPDAFWRGLGGPAWARSNGATVVHLLAFVPPIMALSRVDPPGEGGVPIYFGVLLALYGATRAARALSSGVPVLLGPILVSAGFIGWSLLSARLDLHQAEVSVAPRGAVLGVLGLLGAIWLDARFGAWSAGLRRGTVAAALGLGLGAPALGAVSELGIGWLGSPGSRVLDFDATRVLRAHWRGEGKLNRAWFTLETSGRTLDLGQAEWAALGPGETWVVSRGRWEGETVRDGSLELPSRRDGWRRREPPTSASPPASPQRRSRLPRFVTPAAGPPATGAAGVPCRGEAP